MKNQNDNLDNNTGKVSVHQRELTLHSYWNSNTSEERTEIVERAFKMVEKQKEYIKILKQELDETAMIATVHGWKSRLVEDGKKLRIEMEAIE